MDMEFILLGVIVLAFAAVLIRRIIGGQYGQFQPSGDVTSCYENFRVDSGKNYYISSSDTYPAAIIGIDKTWTLETDLWQKKELSAPLMKEFVQNMQAKALDQGAALHGFDIFDNKANKIGDWFSFAGISLSVKITGERKVVVYPPPNDIYR